MSIVKKVLSDLNLEEVDESVVKKVPEDYEGDLAIPCFSFAKTLKKAPNLIAQDFANTLKLKGVVEKIIAVGPYLNVVLNKKILANFVINNIYKNENYGFNNIGKGEVICIDYSSITLSKHFHIGHLCTTVIGECIGKLLELTGYRVVRINYLGDLGTPFGKILTMYKLHSNEFDIENITVNDIQKLYARFAKESENDPLLIEDARNWSLKIEQGDSEATNLCEKFKSIALEEAKKIYNILDINFDDWRGESYYNTKTGEVLSLLKEKGLLIESCGAKCVNLEAFDMGMCLVQRSDGGTLYTTRDLAAAIDRYNCYNFSKSLYVTGIEQNHHFNSFFKVLELMGYNWAKNLKHIGYGRLSTTTGKISGREGNTPIVSEIFKLSIEKAKKILGGKNKSEYLASDIGTSAIVFGILKTEKIKDSVFDLDRALSFEGETSVYLQYSYVRLRSILSKQQINENYQNYIDVLTAQEESELLLHLDKFPKIVSIAASEYEPCYIARYAIELATMINRYYGKHKVISEDNNTTQARLILCKVCLDVLGKAMNILGVKIINEI